MLIKSKRAQQTAEYAIVLGLVVGAVVAMQVYVKRGLQGRIQQFATINDTNFSLMDLDPTTQYEPYYLESDFNVSRESFGWGEMGSTQELDRGSNSTTTREIGGVQQYTYNNTTGKILKDED